MTKMIPPVPTAAAVLMPTPKQKIGFSIASIVGSDGGSRAASPAANNNNNGSHNNHNNHNNVLNNNSELSQESTANNNNNNMSSSTGPSSPPQTPPSGAVGSTHLPPSHPYALLPPAHGHGHGHAHLPPHLSPAQQHALHQHLLLQHHHQQQQQQQQQLQIQQQNLQQHLEASPKSLGGSPARPHDIQDIIQRLHHSAAASLSASFSPPPPHPLPMALPLAQTRLPAGSPEEPALTMHLKRERSPAPPAVENAQNPAQRHQPPHTPPKSVSPLSSHPSSPPSLMPGSPGGAAQPQPQPPQYAKPPGHGPLLVPGLAPAPGLVRPFAVGPAPSGPPPPPPGAHQGPQQGMPDIKALPPYINAPPELPPQHNPHLLAAAQFQMAAALQAGHVLGPAAAAAAAAGLPPHGPFMPGPGMPRDSYPLYPWLLSRHGRIFPHRFPGNFLLQPFRKPKRIRTAFSPSQLLKLEHAFESNQYVVGAERKALAQSLNLSETQVKVWFQNRRTKHKRMQQEDEKGGGNGGGERNSQGASCDEDDDELIDMEMDDCPSDEEHDLDASH